MANYSLGQHLVGQGLLDAFSFFHEPDHNRGFVSYQNQTSAHDMGLVSIGSSNHVKLGVDSKNVYQITDMGRPSVKLTSNEGWTHGLFIADFSHMPASTCGTWPAFWALNNADDAANWPQGGELDIIEGQNDAQQNLFAAHTTAGCSQPAYGFAGTSTREDCGPDDYNLGCPYVATDDASYGDTFNVAGGGVYAMQWESDGIKIWHWKRADIPENIRLAPLFAPDPETWGTPQAVFGGERCNTDSYFYNMSLAININFCGDYAGNLWTSSATCKNKAPTCEEYVAANPQAFAESYWEINYIEYWHRPSNTSSFNSTGPANSTTTSSTAAPFPLNSTVPATTRIVTISKADPSTLPTGAAGGLDDPSTIDKYTLLGCYAGARDAGFEVVADLPDMTNDACVAACAADGSKYAGTYRTSCYCARTPGDAHATAAASCNVPCPGSSRETCGGLDGVEAAAGSASNLTVPARNATLYGNSTLSNGTAGGGGDHANTTVPLVLLPRRRGGGHHHRDAPPNVLLTLYGNLTADGPPPAAPGLGRAPAATPSTTTADAAVATTTTAVTVTYSTVCATNPALLVAAEYRTTVTLPCASPAGTGSSAGYRNPSIPAGYNASTANAAAAAGYNASTADAAALVPMATYTETCRACGPRGESTITLTVPAAVAAATGAERLQEAVTVVAYATVVPVVNASVALANTSSRAAENVPVRAGASAGSVVAWGAAIWAGLFGVMVLV